VGAFLVKDGFGFALTGYLLWTKEDLDDGGGCGCEGVTWACARSRSNGPAGTLQVGNNFIYTVH